MHIENYTLGASYCRHSLTHGGVAIFVHNSLSYTTINLNKIGNDYDFEACAIKLRALESHAKGKGISI